MAILRSQRCGSDCGPTCFANTLNILGYNIGIAQANKLCRLRKEGTDSDDLIKAFDKYGFEGRDKTYYTSKNAWKWLIKNTNLGVPTIISVDNDRHWALVLLAGKNKAQLLDPEYDEPELIERKDLLERWMYIPNKQSKPRFHSLALIPYKDKSIQAVIMRERLIATMDVK
jgi:ABC-type bacteriocin/lantibiotic exporter with double-glycine peptidase domain